MVVHLGAVRAVEDEVGSEIGVDFSFVFTGQLELANADQARDELLSSGMSCRHPASISRLERAAPGAQRDTSGFSEWWNLPWFS